MVKGTTKKPEAAPAEKPVEKPIEGVFKEQGAEMALAVAAPKEVALSTQDPTEFLDRAVAQANALKKVIDAKKLAIYIGGGTKAHVLIDGWQTLMALNGVMPFTLSAVQTRCVKEECQVVDKCRGGRLTAHIVTEIRRVSDGTVLTRVETECSQHERRWAGADDYAVISMAQTRGVGKGCRQLFGWVMALAGFSATPAEEMPAEPRDERDPGPPTEPAGPSPVIAAATAPPITAPAPAAASSKVSDSEYADLPGWPELKLFHRYGVDHQTDPRVALFRKFMVDHGLSTWRSLAEVWEKPCQVHKEYGATHAKEVATLISPMGMRPDQSLQPDAHP